MEDIFDTLPQKFDPVQFQPEQDSITREDSFLDEFFSVAAVAGTAAIGYELMTMEEDKERKERQEMDQADLFGGSPVFPDLPILKD